VAYTDEPTTIDRCTFDSNVGDAQSCNGGAIYLEDTHITMTATTISNNDAEGGGLYAGGGGGGVSFVLAGVPPGVRREDPRRCVAVSVGAPTCSPAVVEAGHGGPGSHKTHPERIEKT
jgi:hypothetical protein